MSTHEIDQLEAQWRASPTLDRLRILRDLLPEPLASRIVATPAEFMRRATGLNRAGVVAVLRWHRFGSKCAVGIDTALVHAFVDLLLGDARPPAESRLQVTPVEWGIIGYLAVRVLKSLSRRAEQEGGFGPWDATIDRVGPDPFDVRELGPILTVTWSVGVGETTGAIRLWLPERLVAEALASESQAEVVQRVELEPPSRADEFVFDDFDDEDLPTRPSEFTPEEITGPWKAVIGTITLHRGPAQLRPGRVLPLDIEPSSEKNAPPIRLIWPYQGKTFEYLAEFDPRSSADRLILRSARRIAPTLPLAEGVEVATVEVGSTFLQGDQLDRLAPGSVVPIERDADAPVSLVLNGKVVAQGIAIKIEDDPGVRLTVVH